MSGTGASFFTPLRLRSFLPFFPFFLRSFLPRLRSFLPRLRSFLPFAFLALALRSFLPPLLRSFFPFFLRPAVALAWLSNSFFLRLRSFFPPLLRSFLPFLFLSFFFLPPLFFLMIPPTGPPLPPLSFLALLLR